MIINYTALCKIQLVLRQTTHCTACPAPIPRATQEKENHCDAVARRLFLNQTTEWKPAGHCGLWCEGSHRGVAEASAAAAGPTAHGQL